MFSIKCEHVVCPEALAASNLRDSEEEGERRPRPKKARKDNDNIVALGDYGMLLLRELFS